MMRKPLPFEEPQYVTRPYLPPREDFCQALGEIWESRQLTNEGPIVRRFGAMLSSYLGTNNISIFNNGTLALQIALQALGISGEVITTPVTFVATTHALFWNKIRPVFCDIDPVTCNLDPDEVERAITPWTTAVLAVHIYGNPCHLSRLADICARHRLALIYDAAHAFGVRIDGKPISDFGHMTMHSFHATKLFHSCEGGLLVFQDPGLKKKVNYLKNFGFENEDEVVMPGTNAKMSEMHALMGIFLLQRLDELIEKRKMISATYRERLASIPGIAAIPEMAGVRHNYAYMPVRIDAKEFGCDRDALHVRLKEFNIHTRRYFYPLLCDYPCYRSLQLTSPLSVARKVSGEILTLPMHQDLLPEDVHRICDAIAWISPAAASAHRVPTAVF